MAREYITRQLSIFAPDTPGALAKIAKIFLEEGVNVSGFCLAEAHNFGVVRAVVDKPDAAFAAFEKRQYLLKFTDVLIVEMQDVPGGLYEVASRFGELGLNLTYAYAAKSGDVPTLVVYVSNTDIPLEEAVLQIQASGLTLVPAHQQAQQ